MKTQLQIFYEEERKIGEANELFMEMVRDGTMTNQCLAAMIKRRPHKWGRFAGFTGKLKDEGVTT